MNSSNVRLTRRVIIEVWILDGQAQEVQDALVVRARADVRRHAVPVVAVQLQRLQQQQRLLLRPLAPAHAAAVLSHTTH